MFSKKLTTAGFAGAAATAILLGSAGTAVAQTGSLGSLGSSSPTTTTTPAPACEESALATETSHEGWTTPTDETPAQFKVLAGDAATNASSGPGALFFPDYDKTAPEPKPGTSFYKTVGKPLSSLVGTDGELTPIGYSYFSDASAPALQLRITGASYFDFPKDGEPKPPAGEGSHFTSGFATIVLSPEASNGAWKTLTPEQVSASTDFWVTKSIAATPGVNGGEPLFRGDKASLADIIKMNPNATLDQIGVQKTRENTSANTYVDDFVFGCETTDFEVAAPAGEDDNGGPLDFLKPFIGSIDVFGSLFGDDDKADA